MIERDNRRLFDIPYDTANTAKMQQQLLEIIFACSQDVNTTDNDNRLCKNLLVERKTLQESNKC